MKRINRSGYLIVLIVTGILLMFLCGLGQQMAESGRAKRPMMGQDSFGLSVCTEVPKELVGRIISKQITDITDFSTAKNTGCKYYTNRKKEEYLIIAVVYMNTENQKKGQKELGRSITKSGKIAMEHFIALQENGMINAIYLVMASEKYIRIDRSAKNVATNEQLTDVAAKVAEIALYR
jgi:hypothetical protein